MKLALIQDQLLTPAGSERMFLYMAQEFREAALFTLCYNPRATWPGFLDYRITTHWVNPFIQTHERFKTAFPLATWLMQAWDFREYDVILTSSATTAKYIRRHRARHVCYCYFPTRAIWTSDKYFSGAAPDLRHRLFRLAHAHLTRRDLEAARRVDQFIAISESSREAIQRFYDRDADVLCPPVDTERFGAARTTNKNGRYLLVSRLQRWKRVGVAVDAFTTLGLPLDIIGTGPEEARLRAAAGPNIRFLGVVDDDALARAYGEAKAVVFTPELEYGLIPLEAAAAGTPSIALGRGGVLETVVGLNDSAGRRATGVFFDEQTPEALVAAVHRFEGVTIAANDLVAHAAAFSIAGFQRRLRELTLGNASNTPA